MRCFGACVVMCVAHCVEKADYAQRLMMGLLIVEACCICCGACIYLISFMGRLNRSVLLYSHPQCMYALAHILAQYCASTVQLLHVEL